MATESTSPASRHGIALETARRLIDALELSDVPIEKCLMMAQRLARLLRDTDAQQWLSLEMNGYPEDFDLLTLNSCARYAWRQLPKKKIYTPSLPSLEASAKASEVLLEKAQPPAVSKPVANFLESDATLKVLGNITKLNSVYRDNAVRARSSFARMKGALHQYASDTLISLELGEVVEGIFALARSEVDALVRSTCPAAATQLVAAEERLREANEESYSAALTACRRVLSTVADALYPPSNEPYRDGSGKERKVGRDQYVNRLLAYIEQTSKSGSWRRVVDAEMSHLGARVNAVYDLSCKGVHATVDEQEARLAVIHTYMLLAEVAHAWQGTGDTSGEIAADGSEDGDAPVPADPGALGRTK